MTAMSAAVERCRGACRAPRRTGTQTGLTSDGAKGSVLPEAADGSVSASRPPSAAMSVPVLSAGVQVLLCPPAGVRGRRAPQVGRIFWDTASRRRHLDRSSPLTGSCGRHRVGGGEHHDRKSPRCPGGNYCTRDRRHRPPRRALQRTPPHMARPPSMPVRAAPATPCPVPNKKSRITHVATLPNSMTA